LYLGLLDMELQANITHRANKSAYLLKKFLFTDIEVYIGPDTP
jgi:hypothetical protein